MQRLLHIWSCVLFGMNYLQIELVSDHSTTVVVMWFIVCDIQTNIIVNDKFVNNVTDNHRNFRGFSKVRRALYSRNRLLVLPDKLGVGSGAIWLFWFRFLSALQSKLQVRIFLTFIWLVHESLVSYVELHAKSTELIPTFLTGHGKVLVGLFSTRNRTFWP